MCMRSHTGFLSHISVKAFFPTPVPEYPLARKTASRQSAVVTSRVGQVQVCKALTDYFMSRYLEQPRDGLVEKVMCQVWGPDHIDHCAL